MSQKTFSASIDINAPAEIIYIYTTDLKKLPLWTDAQKVENVSDDVIKIGTTYTESYKYRARLVEVKSKITELIPGKSWAHDSKAAAYNYNIAYTLEQSGEVSKVTSVCELEFGGLFGASLWFHFISERMGRRQLQKNLKKLKELMETQDQSKVSSE